MSKTIPPRAFVPSDYPTRAVFCVDGEEVGFLNLASNQEATDTAHIVSKVMQDLWKSLGFKLSARCTHLVPDARFERELEEARNGALSLDTELQAAEVAIAECRKVLRALISR